MFCILLGDAAFVISALSTVDGDELLMNVVLCREELRVPRVTVDLQVYPIAVLSRREIAPALGGILQPRPHSGAHLDHSIWNAEQTNSSPALPGCEYIARNVRDEGCVVCIGGCTAARTCARSEGLSIAVRSAGSAVPPQQVLPPHLLVQAPPGKNAVGAGLVVV